MMFGELGSTTRRAFSTKKRYPREGGDLIATNEATKDSRLRGNDDLVAYAAAVSASPSACACSQPIKASFRSAPQR